MAFFEENLRHTLQIERMVFHIVGPNDDDFVRLQEVDPGVHRDFFVDRILSVDSGAQYLFSDASATMQRLSRVANDEDVFQAESEALASDFQRKHGGSAAAGAFLIFVLSCGGQQSFALLKYDDETVVAYDVEEGEDGRKRVTLDALEKTFVKNRNALQKAALIRLTASGGELVVSDRQNPQKVARYFESFLDAIRQHTDADLTSTLVKLTRKVVRENRDLVPDDVYREVTRRTYQAASTGGVIDGDNQKAFLDSVFGGPIPDDHAIISKFQAELRRERIDGVPLQLDHNSVSPPNVRRYKTHRGISIKAPLNLQEFITVEDDRIIINDTIANQYDESERTR